MTAAALAGLAGFALTLVLIGLGLPVAVAMAVVGIAGYWWLNDWFSTAYVLGAAPFESVFPYSFSVIPLFVLMGVFAARAGLSRSLFDMINGFCGHLRGGLAVSSIGASAAFGAICGSSLATVATIGRVAMPEMRRFGYDDSLSAPAVAAGGTLGVLIPPSILLVLYGLLTQSSIGQLFMAAIIPGLLGALLYAFAIIIRVRLDPSLAPPASRTPWPERLRLLARVWQVLALFLLVIGGIYAGWFSPTEAAAVGATGAFLLALASGQMSSAMLRECVRETAALSGMIFFILVGAALFNNFLETTGLPRQLVRLLDDSPLTPNTVLILILLFYIVLGCFMDSLSMILLTVPLLAPVASGLGIDPILFGILVVTVAEVGLITPPVGMNLFVVQGTVPDLRIAKVWSGVVPFVMADIVRLALLLAFPALALWLPGRMF
jgi:tripartite ATP-independent transporter DctM subunit